MTIAERLTAACQAIVAEGDTVGRFVVGLDVQEAEGVYATSFDLGFASVEVAFVEGSAFGLERIHTTIDSLPEEI